MRNGFDLVNCVTEDVLRRNGVNWGMRRAGYTSSNSSCWSVILLKLYRYAPTFLVLLCDNAMRAGQSDARAFVP